jgi:hypothetical protein
VQLGISPVDKQLLSKVTVRFRIRVRDRVRVRVRVKFRVRVYGLRFGLGLV